MKKKLLDWITRTEGGVLESQIVGSGMTKVLNALSRDGLVTPIAHATVKERGENGDFPATAWIKT